MVLYKIQWFISIECWLALGPVLGDWGSRDEQ